MGEETPDGKERLTMGMSRQEILDYALRYISADEVVPFPMDGDVFCILQRHLPQGPVLKDDEGWQFGGYNICTGYTLDETATPLGKWLWMHYASLATFPPEPATMKVQPPHVAKGMFQNAARTMEFRILLIGEAMTRAAGRQRFAPKPTTDGPSPEEAPAAAETSGKILQFPTDRARRRKPQPDDLLPDRPA